MKAVLFLLAVLLLPVSTSAGDSIDGFHYVSPHPDARFVARGTSIILRPESRPTGGVQALASMEVQGSVSGAHVGEWIVAGNGETFLFRPHEPFSPGETVSVIVPGEGVGREDISFRFTISSNTTDLREQWNEALGTGRCGVNSSTLRTSLDTRSQSADTPASRARRGALILPEGLPDLTVTVNDGPAPGYLFAGPRLSSGLGPQYAVMLDNTGSPAFFRQLPAKAGDFKMQKHADLITYIQSNEFHVANESLEFQDSFSPENGYFILDGHDFQYAPNGNVLVGIIDLQTVDMSLIVPGGNPSATVHGFVLQEQDPAHNVVFQWRSWDHIAITEAVGVDLTGPFIDYIHFNSFDIDTDGDILFSFRELNEMTKIDRQTGDILWRMGGGHNEYTLVGDTRWFERQHSIRRTPTGTVTVFDNGAFAAPWESRAVEYDIDEVNKVATMVWEFRDDPPLFSGWGSNVQRLPNGNTVIDWAPLGIVTEVRPDGTKVFEMAFHDSYWTYRAFRFDWNGAAARPELWSDIAAEEVTLHFAKFGDPDVAQFYIYSGTSPEPTTRVGSTSGNSFILDVVGPEIVYVRVTGADSGGIIESSYSNELAIFVPAPVGVPVVGASGAQVALHQNLPNPFAPSTTISFFLPERRLVNLAIYDVHGRLVRGLTDDVALQGLNSVVWDGRDARGRRAGNGVYFYRLKTGGEQLTRRMALLR